jgi:hypothetical protein
MLYIASFHPVTRRNIPTWFCRIENRKKNLVQHKYLVVITHLVSFGRAKQQLKLSQWQKKIARFILKIRISEGDFGKKNGGNILQRTNTRKFETNIPKKGIALPQSQFSHSCVIERFIYTHDRSA